MALILEQFKIVKKTSLKCFINEDKLIGKFTKILINNSKQTSKKPLMKLFPMAFLF